MMFMKKLCILQMLAYIPAKAFLAPVQRSTLMKTNQHHYLPQFKSTTSRITTTTIQESNEFMDSLLNTSGKDPAYRCTHMIAIPLEQNHDLILDLESVQRGILYHCPLLIGACVAPVVTRMPLILVDTRTKTITGEISTDDLFGRSNRAGMFDDSAAAASDDDDDNDDLLTSRDPITKALHKIVNDVVNELVYNPSNGETEKMEDDGDKDYVRDGRNDKNVQPIMMKFEGLEIDGDQNEILHVVGSEESGTPFFRQVLNEITKRIEQEGWTVHLPEDNPQGKNGGLDEDGVTWRPRIPFMRLPNDFFETLPPPKGLDGEYENYSDELKECYHRMPEEGGNGISPIFWYKWWEDKFCNGKNVRIREIAVYGRTGPMGTSEQAFYIPHLRTKLPDGSQELQTEETKVEGYDKLRRSEQEIMMDTNSYDELDETQNFEKEMANFKSTADRRMLQTVYDLSPSETIEVGEIAEDILAESREEMAQFEGQTPSEESPIVEAQTVQNYPKDVVEAITGEISETSKEKTAEIIDSIAKPMATGDWSKLPVKKNKPKPEDNPILKNWKERVTMAADAKESSPGKTLPPYPSDEHFAGIWHLSQSPGGSFMDEQQMIEALKGDKNSVENLILRIDGRTAGGPILDVENQHRASGGTWKFFQAEWCGLSDDDVEDDSAEPSVQTRLRIRLVIPPSKNKVLVMEGEVKRGGVSSLEAISKANAKELFSSSSFGLNKVGETSNFDSTPKEEDMYLYVSGEAWVEEINGRDRQRKKLGRFSLIKRKDRNPDQYQYNIPAPMRYQD